MLIRSARSLAGALLALAITLTPGFAGVVTYVDSTTWNAAVNTSTLTNIDFTCSSCSGPTVFPSYTNNTNGAVFSGSAPAFTGVYWLNYASYGGSVILGGMSTPSQINITLPSNINAVAMSLGLGSGSAGQATVSVNGTALTGSVSVNATPNLNFFGLTSDTPINSITVYSTNGVVVMDNVSFGGLAQVSGGGGGSGDTGGGGAAGTDTPDPATIVLAGSGLAFIAASKKLRARAKSA